MVTDSLHSMARAMFNRRSGFYFSDGEEAQKWIRTCLSALPLVFFETFDGFFIFEITTLLAEEVHGQRPYDDKFFTSLQRSLAPVEVGKDGTTPDVTRPSRMCLLAYWLMQSPQKRSLPVSWVFPIATRPTLHDVIAWDLKSLDRSLPFFQQYQHQMSLMWPTDEDVAGMTSASRAFRDAVLRIRVTEATFLLGMTYAFPVNINLPPDFLKEDFFRIARKPQAELSCGTKLAAPRRWPTFQDFVPPPLPWEEKREEPLAKKAKTALEQEDPEPLSEEELEAWEDVGEDSETSSTLEEEPDLQTATAQASLHAVRFAPRCDPPLSTTLEDLHVYLAKQDELIRELEQRCAAAEAKQDILTRALKVDPRFKELEKRCAAVEEASQSRDEDLQRQVHGLTRKVIGLKQHETPASAPGLAAFLKRRKVDLQDDVGI